MDSVNLSGMKYRLKRKIINLNIFLPLTEASRMLDVVRISNTITIQ